MISVSQLRHFIVRPALKHIGLWSKAAEQLVLCTALHESHGGTYIDQIDRSDTPVIGPATGIFQMERKTHNDHRMRLARDHQDIEEKIDQMVALWPEDPWEQMMTNALYAAAMCRIHYWFVPRKLPDADDLEGLARYWKDHFNTRLGKGTVSQFIAAAKPYWKKGL